MGDQGARLMGRKEAPTTLETSVNGICARVCLSFPFFFFRFLPLSLSHCLFFLHGLLIVNFTYGMINRSTKQRKNHPRANSSVMKMDLAYRGS